MKKITSLITAIILTTTLTFSGTFAASSEVKSAFSPTEDQKKVAQKTQEAEDSIFSEEFNLLNKEIEEYFLSFKKPKEKLTQSEKEEVIKKAQTLKEIHMKNAHQRIRDYKLAHGWVEVTQTNNSVAQKSKGKVSILSAPSDLILTDELFYNSSTNQYQFSGNLELE